MKTSNPSTKAWIQAARLRTLPLAASTMIMGHTLAFYKGAFSWTITLLSILTAISLQILSNFANDYGDFINGADHDSRKGPKRAVQSGAISASQMKKGIALMVVLCLLFGVPTVLVAFAGFQTRIFFLVLGVLAIWAAIRYTVGDRPYGYSGKGDIAVFVFFGLVTVLGSYYLQTQSLPVEIILPAIACGGLSVGVLNVNNIRDIDSDHLAGKKSLPVMIGRNAAIVYHGVLLAVSLLALIGFGIVEGFPFGVKWLFVLVFPLFVHNFLSIQRNRDSAAIDPFLKQLALGTSILILLFCLGLFL